MRGRPIKRTLRHQIENQEAPDIAAQLTAAFDTHCLKTAVAG